MVAVRCTVSLEYVPVRGLHPLEPMSIRKGTFLLQKTEKRYFFLLEAQIDLTDLKENLFFGS